VNQVTINSIIGLNPPYQVYACNVYGLGCVFVSGVTTTPTVLNLPSPQFDMVPAVGLLIITSDECQKFEVVYCTPTPACDYKQFQDDVCFEFMDDDPYYFQS